jgi:putative pyruvate formate lyase activating enzyme
MENPMLRKQTRRDFLRCAATFCLQAGLSSVFLGCATAESANQGTENATESETETKAAVEEQAITGSVFEPAYLSLHASGELSARAEELWGVLESCRLCPRHCGVNRHAGMSGFCQSPGTGLIVSGAHAHFGEERPLVGRGGSGTIFLSHCGLRCVFCQNWAISHHGRGSETGIEGLADMMLRLQSSGCHNINLVTPTHYSAHILKALDIAAGKGLRLPIVYNTCGWERMEILALLDGVVDIYLPDFKYWDNDVSATYAAGAESYPEITGKAILEMHRQVGVADAGREGIMKRGLMIRHLVMPNNVGGSEEIMAWIAENLPKDTYVNIMAQYTPAHKAYDYPEISRRITREEYSQVVQKARDLGLTNLDVQGMGWLPG